MAPSPWYAFELLKRSVVKIYDHLGTMVFMSLIWALLSLTIVLLPPATAAVYHLILRILNKDDVSVAEGWSAFRKYFWRSYGVALWIAGLLTVMVFDLMFFATMDRLIFKILAGFWVYPVLFVAFAANYAFPLLVTQDTNVLRVVKRAGLVALDNLGFTIVFGICGLIVLFAGVFPPFLLLALITTLGFFQIQAIKELLERYEDPAE